MMPDWRTFGVKMAFPPSDPGQRNKSAYLAPNVWRVCPTFVTFSTIRVLSVPLLTDRTFVLRKTHSWNVSVGASDTHQFFFFCWVFFMIFRFCEKTKHRGVFCVDFHIIVGGFTDPSDPSVLDLLAFIAYSGWFPVLSQVGWVPFKCEGEMSRKGRCPVKHHYNKSIPPTVMKTDMAASEMNLLLARFKRLYL